MESPFKTPRERGLAVALLIVWALLFLPNLRTNPDWYSDEGEWMDTSWTLIHGTPRVGPITDDFLYPYPYPVLYPFLNGVLLRLCGNDLLVGRALGAVTALAAAAVLFWVGTRLKDKRFGFLCAAVFLVYPEVVMNFRWVRSHPLTGTLALVSIGFLVRYVQERRGRDIALAGGFCSLAVGTNYFAYPLIGAVIGTALFVNRRHLLIAAATAGAYGLLFCLGYVLVSSGGWSQLLAQVHRVSALGPTETPAGPLGWAVFWYRNAITYTFLTPIYGADGSQFLDLWPIVAALGIFLFPVKRFRKWLIFWLVLLTFAVFRQLGNVPIFYYPATVFLPLLAVGCAGGLTGLGDCLAAHVPPAIAAFARWAPAAAMITLMGLVSLAGSLGHFRTKVDPWSVRFPQEAEAAMRFVNQHTTSEDVVLVPKHLYWLVAHAKKSMLSHCLTYEGRTDGQFSGKIPHDSFWFDCRWQNAKYLVLAIGVREHGQGYGFDAIYTLGFPGIREVAQRIFAEKWPVVFAGGKGLAYAPAGPGPAWPVAVDGEFVVLENPRFAK